ncbi:MAG: FecR protein [Gemmatimonadetes bacterium]|nr:FecR protein [Gemmatimonadota bacterium]
MSTSVPPRDDGVRSALPSRSTLADEEALHQAFLAEYPTLAAEAKKDLGEAAPGLSQKVVEGAFVRAWDARAQLQNADQLHRFLVEDVHHASARALSRRASAHRLGTHDPHAAKAVSHATDTFDPDESWKHIQHALHGEAHSPKALAELAAVSRHEAAEHIGEITRDQSMWKAIGFGALVVALLIGVAFYIDYLGADLKVATAVASTDARIVTSLPAQIGVVTLDDGSKVRLAPESKLSIPKLFGTKMRSVKIEGAGVFDVAKGGTLPFQVLARKAIIQATGTSFTVRAYPEDKAATIVVGEGSVLIRQGKTSKSVTAGQTLFVDDAGTMTNATPDQRDAADAWRNGTLAITNVPLRDVLPLLRRWYSLTVTVPHDSLLTRKVSLRSSLDSSRQAIRGIEQSTGLEFGWVGQNMVFHEKGYKPK